MRHLCFENDMRPETGVNIPTPARLAAVRNFAALGHWPE